MNIEPAGKNGKAWGASAHVRVQTSALAAIFGLGVGLAVPALGAAQSTATLYQAIDLNPAELAESWAYGAAGGQQVGSGCYNYITPPSIASVHAMLWTGSSGSAVDLHPPFNPFEFSWSGAEATDGFQQVGWGNVYFATVDSLGHTHVVNNYHAVLWAGTATSAVDLHPVGFTDTWAFGVGGGQQVGYGHIRYTDKKGNIVDQYHGLLWTGSAASWTSLTPAGFTSSMAYGVGGGRQVGYGNIRFYVRKVGYVCQSHALLWAGSAASAVDLHPAGFTSSCAYGLDAGQQVGCGSGADGNQHALLWLGSAASVVDLHPAGFTSSVGNAVSNGRQAGKATLPDGTQHAVLWNGTAARAIDLHALLPIGFTNSVATGIDAAGNVVGYAYNTPPDASLRNNHAFLWKPR